MLSTPRVRQAYLPVVATSFGHLKLGRVLDPTATAKSAAHVPLFLGQQFSNHLATDE